MIGVPNARRTATVTAENLAKVNGVNIVEAAGNVGKQGIAEREPGKRQRRYVRTSSPLDLVDHAPLGVHAGIGRLTDKDNHRLRPGCPERCNGPKQSIAERATRFGNAKLGRF